MWERIGRDQYTYIVSVLVKKFQPLVKCVIGESVICQVTETSNNLSSFISNQLWKEKNKSFTEMFTNTCTAGLVKAKSHEEKYEAQDTTTSIIQRWRLSFWAIKGVSCGTISRRTDIMKTLFVCICLFNLCAVNSCGVDPMRYVENYAITKGFDTSAPVLSYMRLNTPSDYLTLMKEKAEFIACTRMVHTGYFKRSSVNRQQTLPSPFQAATETFRKRDGNKLSQVLNISPDDKENLNTGTYSLPEVDTQLADAGSPGTGHYSWQAALEHLKPLTVEETLPLFTQRLSAYEQSSPEFLDTGSIFSRPGLYKKIIYRRR